MITWWKIIKVRGKGADIRHVNESEAMFTDPEDSRFKTVHEFGEMALKMAGPVQNRVNQLTKDTGIAIQHTCNGIVD